MEALYAKNTFNKIPIQKETKALPVKWVFTYKFDSDVFLTKFKARLCVCGNLQKANDREARATTLATRIFRFLAGLVAHFDLETVKLDFVNAYLNSELDETVHIRLPEGFNEPGWALKVLKAFYGLQRSGFLWQRTLQQTLEKVDSKPVDDDACMYNDRKLILFSYFDDVVLLSRTEDIGHLENRRHQLKGTFQAWDLGELKWFLNIQVILSRCEKKLWLCQDDYVEKLAKKFHAEYARKATTPLSKTGSGSLQKYSGTATAADIHFFQTLIGFLIYVAVVTRSDIAYAVRALASQMSDPGPQHIEEGRRVIAYLRDTKHYAIQYGQDATANNESSTGVFNRGFDPSTDAAFADDVFTQRSTDGQVFRLFGGGATDWKSKRRPTVSKSTIEAELLSLSRAGGGTFAWKRLFTQMKFDPGHELTIWCDNLQTVGIGMKEAPALITNLRHIDIHSMWLREVTQRGQLRVEWIKTADMVADGMTKSLGAQEHLIFVKSLGLADCKNMVNC